MRVRLLPLSALLVALAACGGSSDSNTGTNPGGGGGGGGITPVVTNSVSLANLSFNPSAILVSGGSTVTFTNNDGGITHNVTFDAAAITSIGNFSSGSRTAVMPTTAGTYGYHCTLHAGMTGTVKVQ